MDPHDVVRDLATWLATHPLGRARDRARCDVAVATARDHLLHGKVRAAAEVLREEVRLHAKPPRAALDQLDEVISEAEAARDADLRATWAEVCDAAGLTADALERAVRCAQERLAEMKDRPDDPLAARLEELIGDLADLLSRADDVRRLIEEVAP
jgi:ABC-type transporter Mla subunit MlaD